MKIVGTCMGLRTMRIQAVLRRLSLSVLMCCVALVLIMPVNAAVCGDDQMILRVYDTTNAHAARWDQSVAPVHICYDAIFGSPYAGSNPHACDGANTVLRLSGISNAHVQGPDQSGYSVEVCFGDLRCRTTTGSCAVDERLVLSMSDLTNAHVASDASYMYALCCSAMATSFCGDGIIQRPNEQSQIEQCDDGNTVDGDGCSSSCVIEYCGDGIVQPLLGEQCDLGASNSQDGSSACSVLCQNKCVYQGEELWDLGNSCDDGIDNDCDGLVDWEDPGCYCQDRDGDGYTADYRSNPFTLRFWFG